VKPLMARDSFVELTESICQRKLIADNVALSTASRPGVSICAMRRFTKVHQSQPYFKSVIQCTTHCH
jgi:hypothetical protein